MKKRSDPPSPAQIQHQSDRAAELERQAIKASDDSRRQAEEARRRVDETLAGFLDDSDLEDTTGVRDLKALVSPPVPPDVAHVASVMAKSDEPPPDTPTLPSGDRDSPEPVTARPVVDAAKPRDERVLVVDDERDIADLIAERLEEHGYKVRVAYDGVDALVEALKHRPPPDCIILDMGLPYLSGHAVRQAIDTTHLAGIPIIWISAGDASGVAADQRREFVFIRKGSKVDDQVLVEVGRRISEWRRMPRLPF